VVTSPHPSLSRAAKRWTRSIVVAPPFSASPAARHRALRVASEWLIFRVASPTQFPRPRALRASRRRVAGLKPILAKSGASASHSERSVAAVPGAMGSFFCASDESSFSMLQMPMKRCNDSRNSCCSSTTSASAICHAACTPSERSGMNPSLIDLTLPPGPSRRRVRSAVA
jgi:hypothetical protein